MSTNISDERASYQAVFALDIITAAGALILLGTASKPTFQRIIARRFTSTSKSHGTPLKTSLGTYLFLWPALFCLFAAYTTRFVSDLLQTHGFIAYEADLSWNGRPSFSIPENKWGTGVSALTFATTFATILFTVLLNGGVWIHATHIQSNGTGRVAPNMLSKIWNTFILLAMLATGMAAWGVGMSERDTSLGIASMSVTFEVLREYSTTNKNAHGHLARFAFVVVPLIWLRDIFIIYDIILLYVDTSGWSDNASLATTFLLIIFGQFANLTILAMILWGAWRMGRTVKLFDSNSSA
ncbi:hypothetical protein SNOG_07227 [Parastagonospora nodorum SN15]|uniref:Uncharacterized protein n=1 Tax=Phaeosphaeria nodorum (strain SN15 / ATCC MYA-4574 / FGSC 10173) TaxID=321614 RepID=Q0ULY7_PHANO|nr:hypothetical protein SNOG_07227 [Parastagonospora nodorum SN15]EAT85878.2 hypothetical protein SNOG_07227 [Parastagonospora nodorum SN15]